MGIGPEMLQKLNPRLIETHVTGFGWDGPYAHRPGIDPLAQALMGLERAPIEDMIIPIQNDGIRWMGYLPKQKLMWNLGYFNETVLDNPLYPFMDQQYASRVAWLPLLSEKDGKVLHLAANLAYSNPKDDKTQLKAKPEASTAPYFLDTGVFPAEHEKLIGPEVWYRDNSWLFGGAYYFVKTEASEGDHRFQGGDLWMSWLMTGEVRRYNTRGALFDFVYPKKSLFNGGTGALEATVHATYTDADDGVIQGGTFFPDPTRAHVEGSSVGGNLLKIGWIGVGLRMEIVAEGRRIVTTAVRSIIRRDDIPSARPH